MSARVPAPRARSMTDGSPKAPPFAMPFALRGNETAAELNRAYGVGAGTYFGEVRRVSSQLGV